MRHRLIGALASAGSPRLPPAWRPALPPNVQPDVQPEVQPAVPPALKLLLSAALALAAGSGIADTGAPPASGVDRPAAAWATAGEVHVHVERSPYQTIVVVDSPTRRCLRFGLEASALNQSCVSLATPQRLEFQYTRAAVTVSLLWQPVPQRVLVIGLGGGTISSALAALLPAVQIDSVDIDPAVIDVAQRFFGFMPSPRQRVHAQDGRQFVAAALEQGQRYDLIMLDAFDQNGIPPDLFTTPFLAQMKALLTPQGLFLANTFGGTPRYAEESLTAQRVFGRLLNLRLGGDTTGNRLLVATPGDLPTGPALLSRAPARAAQLTPLGADAVWLRTWRFAGRDWERR